MIRSSTDDIALANNFGTLPKINICEHCNGDINIANPTGTCNHVYYPDYCEVCKKRERAKRKEIIYTTYATFPDTHEADYIGPSFRDLYSAQYYCAEMSATDKYREWHYTKQELIG